MENKVTVFENEKFGTVRTVIIDGEPWFVASDVCKALELSNPTIATGRLDEDERSKFNLGRQGEATIVNEYGLYSLVLGSRKSEAKVFNVGLLMKLFLLLINMVCMQQKISSPIQILQLQHLQHLKKNVKRMHFLQKLIKHL